MNNKRNINIVLLSIITLSSFSLFLLNRPSFNIAKKLVSASSFSYFKEINSYSSLINGEIQDDLLLVSNYSYNNSNYYFDSFINKTAFSFDSYNGFFAKNDSLFSIVNNQKLKIGDKYLKIETSIDESSNLEVNILETVDENEANKFLFGYSSSYITFYFEDDNQKQVDPINPYLALYYSSSNNSISTLKAGGSIGKKYGFKIFQKVDVTYNALDFVNWINNDDNFIDYSCLDKYLSSKDIINKMESKEKTNLITSEDTSYINARNRYESWCRANNDLSYYE